MNHQTTQTIELNNPPFGCRETGKEKRKSSDEKKSVTFSRHPKGEKGVKGGEGLTLSVASWTEGGGSLSFLTPKTLFIFLFAASEFYFPKTSIQSPYTIKKNPLTLSHFPHLRKWWDFTRLWFGILDQIIFKKKLHSKFSPPFFFPYIQNLNLNLA